MVMYLKANGNNKIEGNGKMIYKNGDVFECKCECECECECEWQWKNGDIYEDECGNYKIKGKGK
jgi:hypothetical protein